MRASSAVAASSRKHFSQTIFAALDPFLCVETLCLLKCELVALDVDAHERDLVANDIRTGMR